MFDDPHFAAREAIVRLAHPDFGEIPMANVAPKLSDSPGSVRHAGPELGEHNSDIYGRLLGVTESDRAALAERGII
jgi:formyl-CoA transferase